MLATVSYVSISSIRRRITRKVVDLELIYLLMARQLALKKKTLLDASQSRAESSVGDVIEERDLGSRAESLRYDICHIFYINTYFKA
jgi:hypothetical protein